MKRLLILVAVLWPNCTGCLHYAYPTAIHVPELTVPNPDGSVHAFRVDIDTTERPPEGVKTQYTLSRIPIDARGQIPSQLEIAPATGVLNPFGFKDTSVEHNQYTMVVRVYRPGYRTIEVKAWEKSRELQWMPTADLLAQEKAIDDLLGVPGGDEKTPWWPGPASRDLTASSPLQPGGVSSLRFDKRAIGASAGAASSEEALRFTTYVDDAVAWARLLRAQRGVTCVVILGHSEGALIGAMAAAHVPQCGVIEISGPGRPLGVLVEEQLRAQATAAGTPAATEGLNVALHILTELRAGRTVADVPPFLTAIFRPSVQPYLISELNIDPAQTLAAVHTPALIMQGNTDLQVSVADAQRLRAGRPDARLVILDGVNHVLKDAPVERGANIAAYADPNLPLSAAVVPTLLEFVRNLPPAS